MQEKITKVVEILQDNSDIISKDLAKLLSARNSELAALCVDDVGRLQKIISLYQGQDTRKLSELLIQNANGLAHLCARNDFFNQIITLSLDKSQEVSSLGHLMIENSFGLVFLCKQVGEDSLPKIIALYTKEETRDLSVLIMNNALELGSLCIEDKEFFDGIIKDSSSKHTITRLEESLSDYSSTIDVKSSNSVYNVKKMLALDTPPSPRAARTSFIDSLSEPQKLYRSESESPSFLQKVTESRKLDLPDKSTSFAQKVTESSGSAGKDRSVAA